MALKDAKLKWSTSIEQAMKFKKEQMEIVHSRINVAAKILSDVGAIGSGTTNEEWRKVIANLLNGKRIKISQPEKGIIVLTFPQFGALPEFTVRNDGLGQSNHNAMARDGLKRLAGWFEKTFENPS